MQLKNMYALLWTDLYVIGRRLTRARIFNSGWEKTVFSTGLGLGFIACVIFALGLLHVLYKAIVISVLSLITILCLLDDKAVRRDIFDFFGTLWTRKALLIIGVLGALFLLPYFLLPLYPPTAFDATMSHLPSAKAYAQNHGLIFLPFIRFSLFPQINEMLFSLMLILSDDVAAQLVQFLMMGLVALGLYAWGQRLFNSRVGCWAAALWISSPLVLWAGSSAYIDIGLACFIFFGVYAFSNWMDSDETHWLIISAAFLGFAAAAKYSALFFLALLGLILVFKEIKKRRFRQIALFTTIAALIAGPWYLRTYYYTGNPVSPFSPHIFGDGFFSENEVHTIIKDLTPLYGTEKTFKNVLLLPWNLTFKSTLFHAEALITSMYLLALPLVFFFSMVHSRIRMFLILIVLYVVFWFSSSQDLRYLIPIFPFLSLVVAGSLDMLTEKTRFLRKPRWKPVLTISVAIALIWPGWLYALRTIRTLGTPPANTEQRELFLKNKAPDFVAPPYGAIDYLNKLRGSGYAIYALYAENMAYFVDGTWRGGDWFGLGSYRRILSKLFSSEVLYQELQSLGSDYFLVNKLRYRIYQQGSSIPQDNNFHRYFRLIYAQPGVEVYELAREGVFYQQ